MGPWPEPPPLAVVLLVPPGAGRVLGALVVGLSGRLPWDEGYREFLTAAVTHVASLVAAGGTQAAPAESEARHRPRSPDGWGCGDRCASCEDMPSPHLPAGPRAERFP